MYLFDSSLQEEKLNLCPLNLHLLDPGHGNLMVKIMKKTKLYIYNPLWITGDAKKNHLSQEHAFTNKGQNLDSPEPEPQKRKQKPHGKGRLGKPKV